MNKLTKILVVGLTILATLALAGCGEEKKYNELKNQVLPQIKQLSDINADVPKTDFDKQLAEQMKEIDQKINKMQEYANSETKLNNDLIALKKEYQTVVEKRKSANANYEFLAKMNREVSKTMDASSLVFGAKKKK